MRGLLGGLVNVNEGGDDSLSEGIEGVLKDQGDLLHDLLTLADAPRAPD